MAEVIGVDVCIDTDEMKQTGEHSGQSWKTNKTKTKENSTFKKGSNSYTFFKNFRWNSSHRKSSITRQG